MTKKFRSLILLTAAVLFTAFLIYSCKKNETVTPNQEVSLFAQGGKTVSYLVPNDPAASFKIGLGITKPAPVDRHITFSVTSPTGAVEGTQYSISTKTVTIPAGKVVDSVTLKGLFFRFPVWTKGYISFQNYRWRYSVPSRI